MMSESSGLPLCTSWIVGNTPGPIGGCTRPLGSAAPERELAVYDALRVTRQIRAPEERLILLSRPEEGQRPVHPLVPAAPVPCRGSATLAGCAIKALDVAGDLGERGVDLSGLLLGVGVEVTEVGGEVGPLGVARRDVATDPQGLGGKGEHEDLVGQEAGPDGVEGSGPVL